MLRSSILLLTILLASCATNPPAVEVRTQKVEVGIRLPCDVQVPDKPVDDFDKLTKDSDLYSKVQALLADRLNHLGYEEKLRSDLDTCTK